MTSHVLRITDGTTTKTFTSGDSMTLVEYDPVVATDNFYITEKVRINFASTTPATNTANIAAINKLFRQAQNYARSQTGDRVYIEFDEGATATFWRSEIVGGRITFNGQVLSTYQYDQSIEAEIEWIRQPFWEGALTQLPLTNSSATDDTAGITVNNANDTGTVQIETATVVGTITGDGNASFTLTAAGMTGSPITESVAVLTDDTPTVVATKAAAQLNTNSDITDLFNIASSGADVIVTRLVPAANDATLNLAYDNDTCAGLTPDATSADTQAGSVSAHENWVSIDGVNDMLGDRYAPVKVQMYNSYASADPTDEIRLFHNVFSTPASLTHILEGEDATGAGVVSTPESGDNASEGFYGAISWTATTETKIATWTLSAAQLEYMAGGRFGILARWYGAFPYSDCYLRLTLEGASGVLFTGDLLIVPDTREMYLIDVMRLPPYLYGQADIKEINLCLYALRDQSGEHTINLDYLQLSPISGDAGWKRFKSGNAGIDYEEYFIYDDTERFTYRVDTSGNKIAEFQEFGGPLLLVPGETQRVYFNTCDINGLELVEQTWTVKIWYRPRRSSL